jgi:hypothetical protein
MKGNLGMEHPSLKRLRGSDLRGSSFTEDPGRYVKKVSGYGYLYPWGPLSIRGELGMWGSRIPGTLRDEWRALVVGQLSARYSIKGTLREGSFLGNPKDEVFERYAEYPVNGPPSP